MIRVVVDTNITVSAVPQPPGPPAQVFELALGGVVRFCAGGNIYAEYEEVICRQRFQRTEKVIAGMLQAVREKGFWVGPTETVRTCADKGDDDISDPR